MLDTRKRVAEFVRSFRLPEKFDDFGNEFLDAQSGRFILQESTHWDYKAKFPFSYSDDYFGGIARLICAFYNTYGGVIIFGVDDTDRTVGHNEVRVNIERLNSVLRSKLSTPIETLSRSYRLSADDEKGPVVDILLVPKRPMGIPPARFQEQIASYMPGVIWQRQAHEVLEARSEDLPLLYASRDSYGLEDGEELFPTRKALPSTPATLKEFIGRRDAMDRLWSWLFISDEPRLFLHGKGGSGKSTLAYEFARIVADTAGMTKTRAGRPIDCVIYLSAKRNQLDTKTGKIIPFGPCDFGTAPEQFRHILALSEWLDYDYIDKLSDSQLIDELKAVFDTLNIFLVIDDIDTLTTAQIDPGMDALYKILIRATSGGKVLYTVRNAPSHSIENSVEVPGLEPSIEYPAFVSACCRHFGNLPLPAERIISGPLADVSERRPLVVETIVGLRRSCGTYEKAIELFRTIQGSDTRNYLFKREYDALPADNKARLLLAAVALVNQPVAFDVLCEVLRFTPEQIQDAISSVLEVFLQVDNLSGPEALYSVGQVTSSFIREVSQNLTQHGNLVARVKYLKSSILPSLPELSSLKFRINKMLLGNQADLAYKALESGQFDPKIVEHPSFKLLFATCAAKQKLPKYIEAREAYKEAIAAPDLTISDMRAWYYMEFKSGFNLDKAIAVCELVIEEKRFGPAAKAEFLAKRGHVYREMAQNYWNSDPDGAFECFENSLRSCFAGMQMTLQSELDVDKSALWTKISFDLFFRFCFEMGRAPARISSNRHHISDFIAIFAGVLSDGAFDVSFLEPSLIAVITQIRSAGRGTDIDRMRGYLQRIRSEWFSKGRGKRFSKQVEEKVGAEIERSLEVLKTLPRVT